MGRRNVLCWGLGTCVLSAVLSLPLAAQSEPSAGYALENGDVNGDQARDLSDPVYLLGHLYNGGPEPMPLAICVGADREVQNGDANGDGQLDVSDGIHLLSWLFSSGQAPAEACGFDLAAGEGEGGHRKERPRIAPVNSRPYGKSYAEWSIEFWRWILAIPPDQNPFLVPNCTTPQEGEVWFIGASFGSTPMCTIPKGKAIFFPLAGTVNDYPCPDPDFKPARGQSLEDFLTEGIKPIIDQFTNVQLFIDGVSAGNLLGQRVTTHLFQFTGNPDLTAVLDPCITGQPQDAVSDGYWVMVRPLPPGEHTLVVIDEIGDQRFTTTNIITVGDDDDDDE